MNELWLDVGGAPLFVRSWGADDALPVLYWHGVGLTSRGSLALNEAGPMLADGHGLRIHALDAPGFGNSPAREPDGYRPQALADLVPPLLAALGLDRVAFVGFSWGADIGCHVAARHADRLHALVLLDAGYVDPPFDPSEAYEVRLERYEREWREQGAPSWDAVLANLRARSRRSTAELEAGWRAGWREEEDGSVVPAVPPWLVAAVEHGIAHAPPSTTWTRLAAGGLPVLALTEGDARDEDLARFAAAVPRAETRRVEGAGHDVLADGGPPVVHAVGDWLARQSGSQPSR